MKLWEKYAAKGKGDSSDWERFSKTADCDGIMCVDCPFGQICCAITNEEIINILNRDVSLSIAEQFGRKTKIKEVL